MVGLRQRRPTAVAAEASPLRGYKPRGVRVVRLADPLTLTALAVLALLCVLALGADVLAERVFHYGFSQQDLRRAFQPPELGRPAFWLGSDEIGRSQVVRLLYGARVSLGVGLGATLVNLTVTTRLGEPPRVCRSTCSGKTPHHGQPGFGSSICATTASRTPSEPTSLQQLFAPGACSAPPSSSGWRMAARCSVDSSPIPSETARTLTQGDLPACPVPWAA